MIDSALMQYTSGLADGRTFQDVMTSIATITGLRQDTNDIFSQYQESRGFTPIHFALLDLQHQPDTLSERLGVAVQGFGIDSSDFTGRSALVWAVEYRCVSAVIDCLNNGACTTYIRESIRGSARMPLLHLLLAGPTNDMAAILYIVDALIGAGADVMSTDQDDWTPLHIAASWNMLCVSQRLLDTCERDRLVVARTTSGETAYDLACNAQGDAELLMLLQG